MTPHNFPERLTERVNQEVAELSNRIVIGMAADWPDYRERVGTIKGLSRLKDFIDELTEDK